MVVWLQHFHIEIRTIYLQKQAPFFQAIERQVVQLKSKTQNICLYKLNEFDSALTLKY